MSSQKECCWTDSHIELQMEKHRKKYRKKERKKERGKEKGVVKERSERTCPCLLLCAGRPASALARPARAALQYGPVSWPKVSPNVRPSSSHSTENLPTVAPTSSNNFFFFSTLKFN